MGFRGGLFFGDIVPEHQENIPRHTASPELVLSRFFNFKIIRKQF
jgi:hypothetical protein